MSNEESVAEDVYSNVIHCVKVYIFYKKSSANTQGSALYLGWHIFKDEFQINY